MEVGDDPGAAGLGGQGLQALDAAGGGDHVPPVGAQEADGGRADAGGGAGDEGAARRPWRGMRLQGSWNKCARPRPRAAPGVGSRTRRADAELAEG